VLAILCAAAACGLLAGCASSKTQAQPRAQNAQSASAAVTSGRAKVAIRNFMFMPMKLTVRVGTRITFHNYDKTAHTATAINGGFDTGTIQPGASATITMRKAGTYSYHCLFHAFMVATINVRS
jgi:plastocyanin